ncbi:PSD1 and planctomycete cytochrome C domain-containing protein [Isosphaeraceae bacterium EP7]
MPRLTPYAILASSMLLASPMARAAEPVKPSADDAARIEFFETSVRPVLVARCQACHDSKKAKAGLRVDGREFLMRGGESGPAMEPGKPDVSRIIEAIRYAGDLQMPPKAKLKDSEIESLTRWVRDGAVWPENLSEIRPPASESVATKPTISDDDRAFWSFQPVRDTPPPLVKDADWARTSVDYYVLSELEAKGLKPVPSAGRRELIRRASFDLTGLPPRPEDVDAFVADESPDAFRKVVDRLLASPHYGERWGRHWLDVARYGEDQAHTFEARVYPQGFRYRDWVVKALNDDKPYDRFLVEQIAGDLVEGPDRLERLKALGFFALGPVYYGAAVFDEIDDRVDTLARGVLGLTVACARCHDHKFDPIPTADYYALAGIFASTQYKEQPLAPPETVAVYDAASARLEDAKKAIKSFRSEQGKLLSRAALADISRYVTGAWIVGNRRKGGVEAKTAEYAKAEHLNVAILDRWIKLLDPESEAPAPELARLRKVIKDLDPARDLSADRAALDAVKVAANALQAYVQTSAELDEALQKHRAASLENQTELPAEALKPISEASVKLLASYLGDQGILNLPKDQIEDSLPGPAKQSLAALKAKVDELTKQLPPKYDVVHSLAEGPNPAHMKVHLRGNPQNLGAEAPRHFLSVLAAGEPSTYAEGSGRLQLANAIASPENPLTARVFVNRVWAQHFGKGLVGTPSNFGKLGERPSHPALLDHLAATFVNGGWSIKSLHREIMLSATYQLAAVDLPANAEVDPENRLLWRANRRRLEIEPWRDSLLAVTGELDGRLGGPSSKLTDAANVRRTFYASVSRHNLDRLLRLFDFPDPNATSEQRSITSVPVQELFVLNSPFMEDRSKALVARLQAADAKDDSGRVRIAYRLLYGRDATEAEVRVATAFLSSDAKGRWPQLAQVLLASNEFLFVD